MGSGIGYAVPSADGGSAEYNDVSESSQSDQESTEQETSVSSNQSVIASSSNYIAIQYSGSTGVDPSSPSADPGPAGGDGDGDGGASDSDGGESYENFFTTGSGGSTYVKTPVSPYYNEGDSDDGPGDSGGDGGFFGGEDYYTKGGSYTESPITPNYGDDGPAGGDGDSGASDSGGSGNIDSYGEFYILSSSASSASTTSPYSADTNSDGNGETSDSAFNRRLSGFAPPPPLAIVLTPTQALKQSTAQQTTRTVTLSDATAAVSPNPQNFDAQSNNNNGRSSRKYTDLDLFFTKKIHSSDVNILTDIESVKRSVRNLVLLNTYEKPFHPEISSGVRGMLFELMTPVTAVIISRQIEDVIVNFEPRVKLVGVRAIPDLDRNAYEVSIEFYVVNTPTELVELTLFLERLR